MKITAYFIMSSFSEKMLAERVANAIKDGWQPQGGHTVVDMENCEEIGGRSLLWSQAMVQYETPVKLRPELTYRTAEDLREDS